MALTTKRIIALPSQTDPQEGDYLAIDNATSGTHKIPVGRIGVEVDDTLTEQGKAADAKAVGDALDEIRSQIEVTGTASGAIATFTDGSDAPMKSCMVTITPKQSGTGTPSPDNVRPISGWESVSVMVSPTEDEADATTTPVNLGRTVYGGEAEIVGGSLTDAKRYRLLDGTESAWYNYEYSGVSTFRFIPGDMEDVPSTEGVIITNEFTFRNTAWAHGEDYGTFSGYGGSIFFRPPNENITTLAEFKTWLASNNLQIVYPLATPQTYQLTPTEVKTLLGENNVWTDSGDVEVVYIRDLNITINNLLNSNGTRSLGMMAMSAPTEATAEEPTDEQSDEQDDEDMR